MQNKIIHKKKLLKIMLKRLRILQSIKNFLNREIYAEMWSIINYAEDSL